MRTIGKNESVSPLAAELATLVFLLLLANFSLFWGRLSEPLVFVPDAVRAGQWWRVLTHPFAHVSFYHLVLDGGALLALYGALSEAGTLRRLTTFAACAAASLLAATLAAPAQVRGGFCGLSGAAHGLMAVWLVQVLREQRRDPALARAAWGGLLILIGKCAVEACSGSVVFGSWHAGSVGSPVAVCHAGGALGGLLIAVLPAGPIRPRVKARRTGLIPDARRWAPARQATGFAGGILVVCAAAGISPVESPAATSPSISVGSGACLSRTRGAEPGDTIVLLHGLCRTHRAMRKMAAGLREHGYRTVNVSYPTRHEPIETLAACDLREMLARLPREPGKRVHFVTHSIGGIVVRQYLKDHVLPELGRVVMLSPPNQGSELSDRFGQTIVYRQATGPAGQQLGTATNSVPNTLGPVTFELGVIAGNRTLNPLYSSLIPGIDDGKVSITRAQVEGMRDFLIVPHSHTFIMRSDTVIAQTVRFLERGRFRHTDAVAKASTQAVLRAANALACRWNRRR